MARIRSIKPEYWKSQSIARLTWPSRLLFIALWSYVDDNGVGVDDFRLIAAEVLPLEDDPMAARNIVRESLDELARESRIVRYTVAGKEFLFVTGWDEHQKIDRPNKARLPRPDKADPPSDPPPTCGNAAGDGGGDGYARDMREDPSPGAVEQGNRGTGEQGNRGQTPAAVAAAAAPPLTLIDMDVNSQTETENQRINRLTRVYTDRIKLANFPAVQGIVRKAVKAERNGVRLYGDQELTDALNRLADENRGVTVETLRIALEGLAPFQRGRPNGVETRIARNRQVVEAFRSEEVQ